METYPEKKETMETKFDIFSSTPKPWEINPTAARKLHSLCSCCFRFCTCRRSGTIHDCAVRDSANQNGPKWGGIESRIVAMKECKKRSYIYITNMVLYGIPYVIISLLWHLYAMAIIMVHIWDQMGSSPAHPLGDLGTIFH